MIKVGINGFGRIGRFVFRAAQTRDDIQIVGINDLCPVDYLAYMLKYDTMHGQFEGTIEADVENSKLIVNGKEIRVTAERNPADLKWNEGSAHLYRENPFGHGGYCLLAGRGNAITITAVAHSEFYVQKTLNEKSFPAVLYTPETTLIQHAGAKGELMGAMRRDIITYFDYDNAPFSNMELGEVLNHPGKWSS